MDRLLNILILLLVVLLVIVILETADPGVVPPVVNQLFHRVMGSL